MLIIKVIKSVLTKKKTQSVYQVRDGKRFISNETKTILPTQKIEVKKTITQVKTEKVNSDIQIYNLTFTNNSESMKLSSDKSIIESSLKNNIEMKFSCNMGGCASCKVKVIKGKVDIKGSNCLTDEEISEGYILACVAYPLEDLVLEI
ncbi:MAG: 2Fe-2S iron-sulfur cluster binding domain-containing protein [Candidatus Sericytochromatia bacterium]|nr:2Fe-2S iron-sulfur cluster binding domain-containing protein [Candidatus Sericytochromatia bacterium]